MSVISELFCFYRRGEMVHVHCDRSVFERWLKDSPTQYPPAECEIVRFVPATPLIAAAPDLLAACDEFVSKYSACASIMPQMKAAIAKAKGEPDAAS